MAHPSGYGDRSKLGPWIEEMIGSVRRTQAHAGATAKAVARHEFSQTAVGMPGRAPGGASDDAEAAAADAAEEELHAERMAELQEMHAQLLTQMDELRARQEAAIAEFEANWAQRLQAQAAAQQQMHDEMQRSTQAVVEAITTALQGLADNNK